MTDLAAESILTLFGIFVTRDPDDNIRVANEVVKKKGGKVTSV